MNTNNFIKFYSDNGISPVSQNIFDYKVHCNRRISLYRTLGITPSFFDKKNVLEIGPGSGYNSIVTASFPFSKYDLVEPNLVGFNKLVSLFDNYSCKKSTISYFNCMLEDLSVEEYDIVICEGLLPGLDNQDEFQKNLSRRVKSGGILIVTCIDSISFFFETLRRYMGCFLSSHRTNETADNFEVSVIVNLLTRAFKSHVETITGMTRPVEDWILDNLINPASGSSSASNEFSIAKCFTILGGDYYFLGSSPSFLSDWTWYKNIPSDPKEYNSLFLHSYEIQKHNLLNYKELVLINDIELTSKLYKLIYNFSCRVEMMNPLIKQVFAIEDVKSDMEKLCEISELLVKMTLNSSAMAVLEFVELFKEGKMPIPEDVSNMKLFKLAFGRGQQYVSLVKK